MTPDYRHVDGYPCRTAGSADVGVTHSILAGSLQGETRTHRQGECRAGGWQAAED